MRLRDWIHPGWFAPYDWWMRRRLDDEIDEGLVEARDAEQYRREVASVDTSRLLRRPRGDGGVQEIIRRFEHPSSFGYAQLHRALTTPGAVVQVPDSTAGRLFAEAANASLLYPAQVVVKPDPFERENAVLAEDAYLAAVDAAAAPKLERVAFQGPRRLSPMPLQVGGVWPGSEEAVVTRIEYGSWRDARYPGDEDMVRIWTRAGRSA